MSKAKSNEYVSMGCVGGDCPKCKNKMERRKRIKPPTGKSYFYTEWDYCRPCQHVQHYDQFKSANWQEEELQHQFFKSI
jgi:hypothetical protein